MTTSTVVTLPDEAGEPKLEEVYPSIGLAYEIALNSYEIAEKRNSAIDSRLQMLIVLLAALSFPILPIASQKNVSFKSAWFITAVVVFSIALGIALWARMAGALRFINPQLLFKEWLHLSEWEFKKDVVYYAGDDFEKNCALIDKKADLSTAVVALFVLEVLLLAAWVIGARP